jgi:MOSC domain-containing protein YiiM
VRITAVFIGTPRSVEAPGGKVFTAGAKKAVPEAFLRVEGFDGDGQGNLRHHGGADRTVCVYAADHYAWWKQSRGIALNAGAFCENLTVEGALENDVCIGDVYRVGRALAQISLPRDPCRTLDKLTGIRDLWKITRDSGRCGFHMRTLQEGMVRAGDELALVSRHPQRITVAMALDLFHGRSRDRELADRLNAIPEFGAQGKRDIAARMAAD